MLDNDNRERKKVLNAIVEAFSYSDSIDYFAMICTVSRSTQNYIESPHANADLLTFFHKFRLGLNTTFCTQNRVRESRVLEIAF